MTMYVTAEDFIAAQTGASISKLPAGELDNYINRAGDDLEVFCGRIFAHDPSHVEVMFSDAYGRVIIPANGFVSIYPIEVYPINSVASITWLLRQPAIPPSGTVISVSTPVLSPDVQISKDARGYGYRIRIFEDFSQIRDPGLVSQWTVTYDGGFVTYPNWLQAAAIDWTAGLLKRRGDAAVAMSGSGQVIDMSKLGGSVDTAKERLQNYVRKF